MKKVGDGLGIGLAVVQRIVELYCGQIWVDPGTSCGTQFVLSLPLGKIDSFE